MGSLVVRMEFCDNREATIQCRYRQTNFTCTRGRDRFEKFRRIFGLRGSEDDPPFDLRVLGAIGDYTGHKNKIFDLRVV